MDNNNIKSDLERSNYNYFTNHLDYLIEEIQGQIKSNKKRLVPEDVINEADKHLSIELENLRALSNKFWRCFNSNQNPSYNDFWETIDNY